MKEDIPSRFSLNRILQISREISLLPGNRETILDSTGMILFFIMNKRPLSMNRERDGKHTGRGQGKIAFYIAKIKLGVLHIIGNGLIGEVVEICFDEFIVCLF